MSIKKSISLLIVSALLVLPSGIAFAGDIDVQTNGVSNCGKMAELTFNPDHLV